MTSDRMEAFSDGVIAIIITIMVLALDVPAGESWSALRPLAPVAVSYVLSFVYLGIYWTNHHHLLQAVHTVGGGGLWANLHLLFWLSLIPFTTAWMGETEFARVPVACYGVVLFMAAVAYYILTRALIAHEADASHLADALGRERKEQLSAALYFVAIPVALGLPWAAGVLYAAVAAIWLIPDRRVERTLSGHR